MKKIIYKTNKLIINNRIKYGEFLISITVEKYFTDEIKQMVQSVNSTIEMDFSSGKYQDLYNKKLHIVTRVNNEIVAYHQLVDARYCILKEILSYTRISFNEKENFNVLLFNFNCVNPKYRCGNLFLFLNYLIAYKYAIENQFNHIAQFIRVDSTIQASISEKHGLYKIVPTIYRISDCWGSNYSNIDTHFHLSNNLQSKYTENLKLINSLLDLNLSNERIKFFNLLNNNILFNKNLNKSKL